VLNAASCEFGPGDRPAAALRLRVVGTEQSRRGRAVGAAPTRPAGRDGGNRARSAASEGRVRARSAAPEGRARAPSAASEGGAGTHALWVATIALLTAGVVVLAGGGNAFWLCLPAVLLVSAISERRLEAFISAAVVAAAAAIPLTGWLGVGALPSPPLTLVVLAASVAVVVAARERRQREHEALRSVAFSDPLTGIANRRLLMSHADYEIARHMRAREKFAVVMLDLDGFKLLNDRYGHAAGDELLCDVAAALTHAMRGQDTVARIGGDEFCVLAPETDQPHTLPLAGRIAHTVAEATAGIETLSASVGIAVFPDDGVTTAELLLAADERLLSAKRRRAGGQLRRRAA
jgi:diguanylate cyclase (GGDEF)-like protein